jgi:hypothetical protein
MTQLSSTANAPLEFNPEVGENSMKIRAVGNKVGWLHSIADASGASFDIKIKDALGRVKFERKNCSSDTEKFGELINLETLLGEDLEVTVDNLQGAKKIQVFLN